MDIVFLLVPLALVLVVVIVWIFMWAIKADQFEDLEGPAHRILMDEDEPSAQDIDGGTADESHSDKADTA